ncbi:MAG: hypothetical protein GY816_12680 [Cytophagales bacterium]|nr:hypothetical protein [Cytophagales bacterium]
MSIERIEQMLDLQNQWAWMNYVALPIIYLIKFGLVSLWVLCGTVLFGYKVSFKDIFHVVLVAEFVWLIPSFLSIIWFGFIDTDYSLIDIQYFQPLSLLNFFDVSSLDPWIVFPLKALNVFEVIYALVLTLGMRKVIKKDWMDSVRFTIPVYGFVTWIVFITFLTLNMT